MILFDEPADVYHSSKCIGSGHARAYIRSARLFKDRLDGLCDDEDTEPFTFGRGAEIAILEPHAYEERVCVKPDGMSFSTKEGKAWRDANKGKIILPFADAQHVLRMIQRMPDEVRELLATGRRQVTVRTELNGLPVQCRPDTWDMERREKWDLKTTRDVDDIERTIFKYGYHIQDRWYDRVIKAETGSKCSRSGLIFVEKEPPYRWRIVELDTDFRAMGDEAVDEALHGIKARMLSGCWDDAGDVHVIASPPRWAEGLIPELAGEEV